MSASAPEPFGVEGPYDMVGPYPSLDPSWGQVEAPAPVEADVRAEISTLCAATTFPTLSTDQLDELVKRCKRADAANRSVYDASWTPTYDINWAVWQGWEMKTANTVGQSDFTTDGNTYKVSQVAAQCKQMADRYRRRVGSSMKVYPARRPGTVEPLYTNVAWGTPQ